MDPEVDWQVEQACIAERVSYILKTCFWTDCKFIVGTDGSQKEFAAHKLILAIASPVFEKMFQNCFSETKNDIIIIDIRPEVFGAMLNFVYCDKIDLLSFDQAGDLCYVANKYMMPKLLESCTEYMSQVVDVSNACRGYEVAKLFDQSDLMAKCKKIICEETSEIIKETSFCDVELSTVEMILGEQTLGIDSEVELLRAIEQWTEAHYSKVGNASPECKDRQKTFIDKLVLKIRFLSMSPEEFADGPALSPLLTKDQSLGIFMNLNSKNGTNRFPRGFSTLKRDMSLADKQCVSLGLKNVKTLKIGNPNLFSLTLRCDSDVKIWGFQIYGQVKTFDDPLCNAYTESMTLAMWDTFNETTSVSFERQLGYGCTADILFPVPVRMLKGKNYVVTIRMNTCGSYTGGTVEYLQTISNIVTFTVLQYSTQQFIHSILFTC